MEPTVAECRFCGKLYEIYDMMTGDQGCCPACRAEAKKNSGTDKGWSLGSLFGSGEIGK